MAKSFKDVVHDSPRTGLGIPVKTKTALSRTNTPPAEPPFHARHQSSFHFPGSTNVGHKPSQVCSTFHIPRFSQGPFSGPLKRNPMALDRMNEVAIRPDHFSR